MQEQPSCFSAFAEPPTTYCTALRQLLDEHPLLREQMEAFQRTSLDVKKDIEEGRDGKTNMVRLHEQLQSFVTDIDPHSEREEGVLFPMMANYIGREGGPIAVMEYEHDQAKRHLALFFEEVEQKSIAELPKEAILKLANYANVVYTTLTDHFAKEEQILFPMAEKMLTDEEKESLQQKIAEIV
ncbi:hemerythrin domain-containing protein [Texcoconibacillus texcoconensis]|nr:hemerythrin domain-containing protein [Texcoconibacillus texcoconensis]